jgi:hypothetical protein
VHVGIELGESCAGSGCTRLADARHGQQKGGVNVLGGRQLAVKDGHVSDTSENDVLERLMAGGGEAKANDMRGRERRLRIRAPEAQLTIIAATVRLRHGECSSHSQKVPTLSSPNAYHDTSPVLASVCFILLQISAIIVIGGHLNQFHLPIQSNGTCRF